MKIINKTDIIKLNYFEFSSFDYAQDDSQIERSRNLHSVYKQFQAKLNFHAQTP